MVAPTNQPRRRVLAGKHSPTKSHRSAPYRFLRYGTAATLALFVTCRDVPQVIVQVADSAPLGAAFATVLLTCDPTTCLARPEQAPFTPPAAGATGGPNGEPTDTFYGKSIQTPRPAANYLRAGAILPEVDDFQGHVPHTHHSRHDAWTKYVVQRGLPGTYAPRYKKWPWAVPLDTNITLPGPCLHQRRCTFWYHVTVRRLRGVFFAWFVKTDSWWRDKDHHGTNIPDPALLRLSLIHI